MRAQPPPSALAAGRLEELTKEVAQLRDLFQRRLLEDKAKNKLYEELYEQLKIARGSLADQLLVPLFRELLLIVDRVATLAESDESCVKSIEDELLEVLERRGVRPVRETSSFDPSVHEAVRTEPRANRPPGTVVEVLRRGYLYGGRLLRAEQVVVASRAAGSDVAPIEASAAVEAPLPEGEPA